MIDLGNWNLTIPEKTPARTIETRVVKAGYKDRYFYRTDSGIVFWAPVTGTSTKGSNFPRSELRETFSDGKLRNWYYKEGTHKLKASLTVRQMPSSGRIVIGQVHSKDSSTPLLKIVYEEERGTGYVNVELRKKPGSSDSPTVLTYKGMPQDTRFDYAVDISKSGELRVDINGLVHKSKINSAWANKRLYFKAGVYTLDNKGSSKEGGKAEFHALSVSHSK